ncbi:MAG: sulfonate ABC transporter substrate-binding protein [Cereibacter sphaeroides]|uniref:Putative aliphatic sulfonates-binding protein n=1 Tax=Cereibacter sphaeroides TaxID=1063 RepID=A0A2W5SDC2_CERSP|nr:MAG: sulfonate ABC transporter substrate-binding protein [Cereibacter sphaeroides]
MSINLTRRTALALGAGALVAAGTGQKARAASSELRIGWQKGGTAALLKGKGLLEERLAPRGITVSWKEFTSGPPLLEALGAGALDFGHTGDVPPLFALAARQDVVLVGTYSGSPVGSAILVKDDSPIKTVADLKGKKLAFKRGSSAHNVALQVLRSGGLTLDDVEQVDLGPPDAGPAFANGSIDAWSIWDPYTAVAEKDPSTRVLATADGLLPSYGFFLANGTYAKANEETIVTTIETLREVGQAAQNDLDGTVAAFAAATGLDPAVLKVVATRKDQDYGNITFVEDKHVAYEQGLANDFHALGIVPVQLDIAGAVWHPKSSS